MSDAEKIDSDKITKKRVVDSTTAKDDDDDDDNIEEPPAKRGASSHVAAVPPMTPRTDPFTDQFTQKQRKCVIYLCCNENTKEFSSGLKKCKDNCNTDVHEYCFQRNGTRHVTMWEGILDNRQVFLLQETCNSSHLATKLPLAIDFEDGWNSWKGGNYIGLSEESTKTVKGMMDSIMQSEHFPSNTNCKISCDHLSLYRKRGLWTASTQLARVRKALATHKWGSLQGISIRIKVLGGEYDECKVLAEAAKANAANDE